jgi:hypothetical protein
MLRNEASLLALLYITFIYFNFIKKKAEE